MAVGGTQSWVPAVIAATWAVPECSTKTRLARALAVLTRVEIGGNGSLGGFDRFLSETLVRNIGVGIRKCTCCEGEREGEEKSGWKMHLEWFE